MMLDLSNLFYLLGFGALFGLQMGFFGDTAETESPDGAESDPGPIGDVATGEDAQPDFIANLYDAPGSGAGASDLATPDAYNADLAYFLGGSDETLAGSPGDGHLASNAGDDAFTLGDGNDNAAGGAGGAGDDVIAGQGGNDVLAGNGGDDTLPGGPGGDTISGGSGNDTIYGGPADDTLSGDSFAAADASGGAGTIDGGAGDDNIFLGDGDEATGGTGADSFQVFEIESPDAPAANITDFSASEDSLHVHYHAQTDPDTGDPVDPGLSVAYDADTDVTSVSLFGGEIATLAGDAGITAADVTLTEIV